MSESSSSHEASSSMSTSEGAAGHGHQAETAKQQPPALPPPHPLARYLCPMQPDNSLTCQLGTGCPFHHRAHGYLILPATICVEHLLGRCANETVTNRIVTRCSIGWHPEAADFDDLHKYMQLVKKSGGELLQVKPSDKSAAVTSPAPATETSGSAKPAPCGRPRAVIIDLGPLGRVRETHLTELEMCCFGWCISCITCVVCLVSMMLILSALFPAPLVTVTGGNSSGDGGGDDSKNAGWMQRAAIGSF